MDLGGFRAVFDRVLLERLLVCRYLLPGLLKGHMGLSLLRSGSMWKVGLALSCSLLLVNGILVLDENKTFARGPIRGPALILPLFVLSSLSPASVFSQPHHPLRS